MSEDETIAIENRRLYQLFRQLKQEYIEAYKQTSMSESRATVAIVRGQLDTLDRIEALLWPVKT